MSKHYCLWVVCTSCRKWSHSGVSYLPFIVFHCLNYSANVDQAWNDAIGGNGNARGMEPDPRAFCAQQIPHGLAWVWVGTSCFGGWRLTEPCFSQITLNVQEKTKLHVRIEQETRFQLCMLHFNVYNFRQISSALTSLWLSCHF